jgi:hypothetical protein
VIENFTKAKTILKLESEIIEIIAGSGRET